MVIEMSTIGPQAAKECAALLAGRGWDYVDAPVSGGEVGAQTGLLTVMASGHPSDIDRVLPILRTVGSRVFVVGSVPGLGQAMKLTVNFTSLATFAALAEATILGERLGLDLGVMINVINASNARSVVSEEKFTRSVVPRTYDFGVRADLVMKDIELFRSASERADTPRAVATAVHGVWRTFLSEFPDADFTALHRFLSEPCPAEDD
jgi:2-hydroxy-3-oxopropionate reductase